MQIKILASGSSGNCAILRDINGNQILLDCGIKFDKITTEINWATNLFCLISHKHGDHYDKQSVDKLLLSGIKVYTPEYFENNAYLATNGYNIAPVRLPHCSDCDSWAFVIYNTIEKKSIFFATDCTELPNLADRPFDLFMIENNYDKETVFINSSKGKIRNLGYLNHLSMEYVLDWLQHRTNKPTSLIITHLSNSGNIAVNKIKERYNGQASAVFIAKQNLLVEF